MPVSINPFDDEAGTFLVLVNHEEHWPDIRPKSLRDRLARDQPA